jgi:hypothetical protein
VIELPVSISLGWTFSSATCGRATGVAAVRALPVLDLVNLCWCWLCHT